MYVMDVGFSFDVNFKLYYYNIKMILEGINTCLSPSMRGVQSGNEGFKQPKEVLKQVIIPKNHFIIVNNS